MRLKRNFMIASFELKEEENKHEFPRSEMSNRARLIYVVDDSLLSKTNYSLAKKKTFTPSCECALLHRQYFFQVQNDPQRTTKQIIKIDRSAYTPRCEMI